MVWAEGVEPFMFVEDENAQITGWGHQDKDAFAAELNRYEQVAGGWEYNADEAWTADDIDHKWVVANDDGETVRVCSSDTPGAFPVTTVWGSR